LQFCLVKTEPDSGLIFGTRFSNSFKEQRTEPESASQFFKRTGTETGSKGVLTRKKG
jgi:hypothetical protein